MITFKQYSDAFYDGYHVKCDELNGIRSSGRCKEIYEMKKKDKRGGKRVGSGRPKGRFVTTTKKEPTQLMRVPMSLVSHVVGLIKKV